MDQKKYIEALNLDLEHEMSSIIRYLHHSFLVRGPIRGPLSAMFRAKANSSMQHAITLGEKVTALGGHPSVKVQEIFDPGLEKDTRQMLNQNLNAETKHLDLYMQQYELFKDNNPLRQLIEQLILEEANHIEELEMYLREDCDSVKKIKNRTVAQVK